MRVVVIVEGVSDKIAVEVLAGRRGLDVAGEGVSVTPVGGAHGIVRFLARLSLEGADVRLAGLCDAGEEPQFRRALERAGLGADLTRGGMEALGFFVCEDDLEAELIRALGPAAIEALLAAHGDIGAFRTLQKQPQWQGRPTKEQLRRFLGSGSGRKIKYARLLVQTLDLAQVPRPLYGVLAHVERLVAQGDEFRPRAASLQRGERTGKESTMTDHKVVSSEEWIAARDELLAREKEHTRLGDELARKRRELPWVQVEKEYPFETEEGTKSLADLFGGRSQLLVYHFMFGPSYEAGCPVCSSIADTLAPQAPHLAARDTTLLLASRGPLEKLLAYRKRMDWGVDWVSSGGSDFNRDLGFLYTEEELKPFLEGEIPTTVEQNARMCGTDVLGYVSEGPGLSGYALSDGVVYRTYVTTARGLEPAMAYYALLDRTPKGRHEDPLLPLWIRRHDEY